MTPLGSKEYSKGAALGDLLMVQFRLPMLPRSGQLPWNAEVNGEEASLHIDGNAILLDVLRDQVGSLGTKRGCDMGTCGCCSVLIDGCLLYTSPSPRDRG